VVQTKALTPWFCFCPNPRGVWWYLPMEIMVEIYIKELSCKHLIREKRFGIESNSSIWQCGQEALGSGPGIGVRSFIITFSFWGQGSTVPILLSEALGILPGA